MYKTGDYVVHKVDGLCKITDISVLDIPDCDNTKKYYYLIPTESPSSKIYVAVGTGEASLRDPLTEKEALDVIDSYNDLDEISVESEKNRQSAYSEALVQNDAKELLRLIKTTRTRKTERLKKGRTATTVDEHFLKSAEHALYGELKYVLGIEDNNMVDFIKARISK